MTGQSVSCYPQAKMIVQHVANVRIQNHRQKYYYYWIKPTEEVECFSHKRLSLSWYAKCTLGPIVSFTP